MAFKILFTVFLGTFFRAGITNLLKLKHGINSYKQQWVDPLSYDDCSGTAQSPIDLIGGRANSNGGFGNLTFSDAWYNKVEGELFDNGHTGNLIKEILD